MYIDCTTSILYVWCPTSASWLATTTAQTPLTVVDTNSVNLTASGTDNHTLQADAIIAPAQGAIDNSLSILASGLYVPDPTDYMVINDLQDVDTVTIPPVVGDVLVWDGTNWTPVAQFTCEQVQDCLTTSLPFATYNDATNDWTLGSVDFHSDVDTTTTAPVVGDVLSWDGTNWVPATSALSCEAVQDCLSASFPFATYNDATNNWTLGSINFHSDVDTVTNPPLTNQPLMWDGTNWTPIDAVCPATTQASVFLGLSSAGTYGWFNARQVLNYRSIAANGTLIPSTDGVVGIDASGGNRTFTLVAPAACDPKDFYIKRLDSTIANTVTINGTIDGAASITLGAPGPFAATGGEAVHLMNIGGNTWIVV